MIIETFIVGFVTITCLLVLLFSGACMYDYFVDYPYQTLIILIFIVSCYVVGFAVRSVI